MHSLDSFRFGRFEVLPVERQLLDDGRPVVLGARAFELLLALIERRDRLVSKGELLDLVWPGLVVEEGNLAVQVSGLRKLIGPQAIATVPGRGYRFAVHLDGAEVAPPRDEAVHVASTARTNVPAAIDTLIGRDADVDELPHWIAEHRLVTLLGPGGIGKTRLAQAAALACVSAFADGVWWVDLAALSSADKVALGIASAARLQLGEPPRLSWRPVGVSLIDSVC
jgi:DNA-binding winged helix-turn-helix (wHTH) protein